jgi:hypothetical protein
MTRIRTTGACLIATFAISAAVATSASAALPEFNAPFPKPFSSTSKTSILETVGKTKVKCTADTNTGEVTGPSGGILTIRLTGCESKKFSCASPGAAPGEIVTHPLIAMLGYVSRVPKEVGLDLSNPAGALLAEFQCGNLLATIKGSAIGLITPINKLLVPPKHFALKFVQKSGIQKILNFAGGSPDFLETSLNGGPFEQTGLASTDLISFGVPAEIKA